MADNEKIISVTFKADPGSAPQQAADAGKQVGDQFTRAAEEAIKKLNISGALEGKLAKEGALSSKSFLDNLSKGITGAISEGVKNVPAIMPQVGQFQSPVSKEVLSDIERATLGVNTLLTGMRAATSTLGENASLMSAFQLGGQAFEYGQRYLRAQSEAAAAARVTRAEAAAARASSTDIVAEMSGAAGFGMAARIGGGGPPPPPLGPGAEKETVLQRLLAKVGPIGKGVGTAAALLGIDHEANQLIGEMGEKAQSTAGSWGRMANTLGLTRREYLELRQQMAGANVDADEQSRQLTRLTLRAQQQLPAIAKEIRDEAIVREEAAIKTREANLGIEQSEDDRKLATISVAKAEAEFTKVEKLNLEQREQARRAAELSVSGAQIGVIGAQMRATQAAINLRAAPEQARIADIQGPLTVEGARLGAQGARIALEEARARYYGQEPDEYLQERKRAHALQVARNNAEQADAQERQAVLNERKRVAAKASGVGPEAQAQLQAAEAEQAQKQAALNADRAETSRKGLEITQTVVTAEMELAQATLNLAKVRRQAAQGDDNERKARQEGQRAGEKETDLRYELIGEIQKAISGGALPGPFGEPYDITKVQSGPLGRAIIAQAGDRGAAAPGGILDVLRNIYSGPLLQGVSPADRSAQELRIFQSVLPGFRGGGLEEARSMVNFLKAPPKELTSEQRKLVDDVEKAWVAHLADIAKVKETKGTLGEEEKLLTFQRQVAVTPISPEAAKSAAEDRAKVEKLLTGILELAVKGQQAPNVNAQLSNFLIEGGKSIAGEVASGAKQLGSDIAKEGQPIVTELGRIANSLKGIVFGPKQQQDSQQGSTEKFEESTGGLLHGLGSGTSDQIPIMASPGEYVIKAETASRLGEPFLNSLNAGHFAEGGEVRYGRGAFATAGKLSGMSDRELRELAAEAIARGEQKAADRPGGASFLDNAMDNLEIRLAKIFGDTVTSYETTGHFAEGGSVDDSGMGKWAAIIKSSQWGIWATRLGLPALGVTIPAAADVALARSNPLISVGLALKAIWDDTHSHPPETLGEVLREQRGGLSVNELMAKHFAETRQATFDERFPSPDKDSIPANFDERFGKAEGDTFAQRFFFGDASGMQEGGTISTKELREELRRRREEYTPQKYTPQSYTPERYTPASYSPQGDASGGGGGGGGGGSGTVAHGPAPDATIIRNPFVSSDTVSYQDRVLMEHDGFDPDNPNDVKLWRKYIGSKLPPNMGMPGGPTGAGVIARGQIARGPAPPILMVKPGAGKDYTIPTPAGGADVRYNPYAGRYWPEGSGKPYDENDQTTFGKPGVTFDPMNSSTWSEGYRNDFYTAPGYTDIKTSDVDLATPIHFGRRSDNDEDKATGGLIRRYFGGGPVGMQAGGFPPAPDMGGAITREALSDLSGRLGHIPTSGAALTPSASAFSGLNTLGVHQLDLRTNAGNFPAAVSEETWAAIQRTSLMNQVSSAGSRPSWYS